jgi:hypothetical protein
MTDVTSIGDLNQSNVDQIYGIEPGSVIKTENKSSDTLAKGVAGWSSPRRGDLSLFRLYFGLIPSAIPTSERSVVDEEGW